MKKARESNYELLRIVSMLFIVIWHVILHGNVYNNSSKTVELVIQIINIFLIIHVNLFILITGYYQSQKKFNIKKIINLIIEVIFYTLIINTILYFTNNINIFDYKKSLITILYNLSSYWFISCYVIFYLLSPFINKFISSIERKDFKKLIFVVFTITSLIPYFTLGLMFESNGYNLLQFLLMYLIGAYIRKYNIVEELKQKRNIIQLRAILIISTIGFALLNLLIYSYTKQLLRMELNEFYQIPLNFYTRTTSYNNPLVIMQAVSMFLLFGTFKFKNETVNMIASTTIGVYIIHENYFLRSVLYDKLGITKAYFRDIPRTIFVVLATSLMIFSACVMIDLIRKGIVYLLNKKTIKLENKFYNFLNKLFETKDV